MKHAVFVKRNTLEQSGRNVLDIVTQKDQDC